MRGRGAALRLCRSLRCTLLHLVQIEHADQGYQTQHCRVGQIESRHAPAALTDRVRDGLVRDRGLPIRARQISGVDQLPLRPIAAAERAVTAGAVLLPSYDRHVVETVRRIGRTGIGDLNLVRVRVRRVIVIAGFPRPQIGGCAIAGEQRCDQRK